MHEQTNDVYISIYSLKNGKPISVILFGNRFYSSEITSRLANFNDIVSFTVAYVNTLCSWLDSLSLSHFAMPYSYNSYTLNVLACHIIIKVIMMYNCTLNALMPNVYQCFCLCVWKENFLLHSLSAKIIFFLLFSVFFFCWKNFDLPSTTELPISITYKKIIINIKVCKVCIYYTYACACACGVYGIAGVHCLYVLHVMQNIPMCDPIPFIWYGLSRFTLVRSSFFIYPVHTLLWSMGGSSIYLCFFSLLLLLLFVTQF